MNANLTGRTHAPVWRRHWRLKDQRECVLCGRVLTNKEVEADKAILAQTHDSRTAEEKPE